MDHDKARSISKFQFVNKKNIASNLASWTMQIYKYERLSMLYNKAVGVWNLACSRCFVEDALYAGIIICTPLVSK